MTRRKLVVVIALIGCALIGGYEIGKLSHHPKPTELDCAFYKSESLVTSERGSMVILGAKQPVMFIDRRKAQDGAVWFECEAGKPMRATSYERDAATRIDKVGVPSCPE